MTTTYQLQAEYMIKKHGIEQALADAWRFAKAKDQDREGKEFWKYVIVWIERIAVQAAAMHDDFGPPKAAQ